MPVHRIRKRYVLFTWQRSGSSPSRFEFEKFLGSYNDGTRGEGDKRLTRLMILDTQMCMGIVKTRHTLVSRLKTQLVEGSQGSNLPKLQVIAVSGTIKKLKQRLFSANPV